MKAFLNSELLGRVKLTEANSKTRVHFGPIRFLYFGLQGRIDRPDPSEKTSVELLQYFQPQFTLCWNFSILIGWIKSCSSSQHIGRFKFQLRVNWDRSYFYWLRSWFLIKNEMPDRPMTHEARMTLVHNSKTGRWWRYLQTLSAINIRSFTFLPHICTTKPHTPSRPH